MTATCAVCGTRHDEELLELSYKRPDPVVELSQEERMLDVFENDDVCVVNDDRYFLRVTLPIPVNGRTEGYQIGVWVEVSRDEFQRVGDLWSEPGQAAEPPMKATLANEIRHHAGSFGLPVLLQLTGPKTRPQVFVVDATHPLGVEQRRGITPHRASEYSVGLRPAPEVPVRTRLAAPRQSPREHPQ